MKVIFLILGFLGFSFAAVGSNTKVILKGYIAAWQPVSINIDKGTLIIPLNQSKITKDIFLSILRNGICLATIVDDHKWLEIKQIVITNKYAKQGYIFDGGYNKCKESTNLTGEKVDLFLLGNSRVL